MPSMDGYVRVSRIAGRQGESFISPEVQREKIEKWSALHEVEVGRWWEELDQSGGKMNRPMFQQALARCRSGDSDGIIVAKLDRFARSAIDALDAIRQLNEAGARLVSVEDGFDDSTPMGQFARGVLLLLAELELQRVRGNWEAANERAVADGVHITGYVPAGYTRSAAKRSPLVPDPIAGPVIREAFRMRAQGTSPEQIARFLESRGVGPGSGNPSWSRQGVAALLKNKVYVGQARGWKGIEKDKAHEPLVTDEEFEAAQALRAVRHAHDGSIASQALLTGLIKCAGCGHNLTITGNTNRDGRRTFSYICRRRYATGICPAPAAARGEIVDAFVREALAVAMTEGKLDTSLDALGRFEAARRDVQRTRADLDALASADLLRTLGPERLAAMAGPLKAAHDDARRRLAATTQAGTKPPADLWVDWAGELEPMERQREYVRQFVSGIVLRRSGKRGRAAGPIGDRLSITWMGQSEPDATVAERVAALPPVPLAG